MTKNTAIRYKDKVNGNSERDIAHRERSIRSSDIINISSVVTIVTLGIWYRHGNIALLLNGGADTFRGLGSIMGLITQLALLFSIFLSSRWSYIERKLGLDHMLVYHRMAGDIAGLTLILHIVAEVLASKYYSNWFTIFKNYTSYTPYMAMATVGTIFLLIILLMSLKYFRRKISYETWYFIHLLVYPALFLSFFHEINLGIDFTFDSIAKTFWVVLNLLIFTFAIICRYFSIIKSYLKPLKIIAVEKIGSNVMEVTLKGGNYDGRAGQFMILRFLTKELWWQSHPFSISSTDNENITFTIKNLGAGTNALSNLKVGEKVSLEGPYGRINRELLGDKKILLIAGGVGVAPIRSLLTSLNNKNEPILLYRATSIAEAPHAAELERNVIERNGQYISLFGSRDSFEIDPLSSRGLKELVPDIKDREIVLCGPELMIDKAILGALKNGVAVENIHHERLWW